MKISSSSTFSIIILFYQFIDVCCSDEDYYHNYNIIAPKQFKSRYERKFAYHNSEEDDGFGKAVSIYQNNMLIGACFNDDLGTQAGSAYIFKLDASYEGWSYVATLNGNDTSEYDYFGWSVALSDGWALVGAWQDDDKGSNSGSAYFFQYVKKYRDNYKWIQASKVYSKDSMTDDFFGLSVALTNEGVALIGAPGRTINDNANSGIATLFRYYQNKWFEEYVLQSPDPVANDYFGISVALYGDNAVVGAYGNDAGAGEESGAAFVYKRSSLTDWELVTKLVASDASANDFFGRSVGINDKAIVIGADGSDHAGTSSGAAYVFEKTDKKQWSELQKLTAWNAMAYDYFGVSVAMGNNSLVVGADGTTHDNGKLTGSVWYYERNKEEGVWKAIVQINASDNSAYDLFGSSVSMYGSSILIGAEMGNGYRYDTGAAYAYTIHPDEMDYGNKASVGEGMYFLIAISAVLPVVGLGWWAYYTKSFSFQNIENADGGDANTDNSRTGLTSGFWWAKNNDMDASVDSRTGLRNSGGGNFEESVHFDSDIDETSSTIFSTAAFNKADRSEEPK